MFDREHVHRAALALGDAGGAARQLGHDDVGIDAVGQHVAMVAIAGDDRVPADGERGLEPDGDGFLANIEVAETADQAEAVKLAGALLEAADQQHLAVEFEQFFLARVIELGLGRTLPVRGGGGSACLFLGFHGTGCSGQGGDAPLEAVGAPIGAGKPLPQRRLPATDLCRHKPVQDRAVPQSPIADPQSLSWWGR